MSRRIGLRSIQGIGTKATQEYIYVGSTNAGVGISESQVEKVSVKTYAVVASLTLPASAGIYLLAAIIDGDYLYVADDHSTKSTVTKINLKTFTIEDTLTLLSGEAHAHDLAVSNGFLYVGCYVSPAKIVKINLSTFTKVGTLTLGAGKNNVNALLVDGGYLYAILGTSPCRISKIDLATFTESAILTLNANENYGGHCPVDDGKLYIPVWGGAVNRVVKVDLATFTREAAYDLTITAPKIISSVHNGYFYVGYLTGHPPVISKINTDLTEETKLTLTQADVVEIGNPQWGMIITQDCLYISLDQYSPASIEKVDLTTYTEVGLCQVWTDANGITSALAKDVKER